MTFCPSTYPAVQRHNEDPVRLGLVASLAEPGGSLTRINFVGGELAAKRLELLREFVPAATRVAVLVNPTNASTAESTLKDVALAAPPMGLQIQVLQTSTSREIDAAFGYFRARATRCSMRARSASILSARIVRST
jgi:putative ABC transport system substrate-binding protein